MSTGSKASRGRTTAEADSEVVPEVKRPKGRPPGKKSSKTKPAPVPVEEEDHHEDHCEACTDGGVLLCCDNCDFAFHFTCAEPPFLPDTPFADTDVWYCRRCANTMKQKEKLPVTPGPFGPIFDLSRSLNPHVFTLPASVRRQSHSERDKAKDAKDLEYADLVKNPDHTLARYTADEAVVSSRRKGKACFICSLAENSSLMVVCDHCRKVYHRYCLDPSPISDTDWVCPSSNDAKHRTKGKKASVKALQALEKEKAEYETKREQYELPFALDFVSGWQPRRTPTDLTAVLGQTRRGSPKAPLSPTSALQNAHSTAFTHAVPPLMTGGVTHAEINTSVPSSRSTQAKSTGQSPTNFSPETILSPQVICEWSTKRIDLDGALFFEQWQSIGKFIDPHMRAEIIKTTKTSAGVAGEALKKRTTIPSMTSKTGSAYQAMKAASAIVMEVGDIPRKCTSAELHGKFIPEIDAILNSPQANEFLRFLGFQRLEQIYQYGLQLNSLEVKASSSSSRSRATVKNLSAIPTPSAPSQTQFHPTSHLTQNSVIELDGGIKPITTGKVSRKRPGDEATLAPANKRSKQKEIPEQSTVPMALSENDWDALVDQAIVGALTDANAGTRANLIHLLQTTASIPSKFDHLNTTPSNGATTRSTHTHPTKRASTAPPNSAPSTPQPTSVAAISRSRATKYTSPAPLQPAFVVTAQSPLGSSLGLPHSSSSPSSAAVPTASLIGSVSPSNTVQVTPSRASGSTRLVISGSKIRRPESTPTTATPPNGETTTQTLSSATSEIATPAATAPAAPPQAIPAPSQSELTTSSATTKKSGNSTESPSSERATTMDVDQDPTTEEKVEKIGEEATPEEPAPSTSMDVDAGTSTSDRTSPRKTVKEHVKEPIDQEKEESAPVVESPAVTQAPSSTQSHIKSEVESEEVMEIDHTEPNDEENTSAAAESEHLDVTSALAASSLPDSSSGELAAQPLPPSSTIDAPVKLKSPVKPGSPPLKAGPEFWKELATREYAEFSKYKQHGVHSVLVTLGPDKRLIVWTLTQPNSTIGRLSANVSLNDLGGAKISRQHAEIRYDAQSHSWTVKVLGRHGLKHNERPSPANSVLTLSDGDSLTLSQVKLIFRTVV